ncbi:MAG: PIG-L family deacetylase, partial [Planctomycetia bacterium]|nr:PIG-L family deacetylase [Planctomycetia bacterium]
WPTRLFVPTITDLHSDHKMTNSEMMISIFHASGNIWPELGEPIAAVPLLYEYATYSNFTTPPQLRIRVSQEIFEKKIDALLAYKSQEQIEQMIKLQRQTGPKEFIREVRFDIFQPEECNKLF